MLSHIEREGIWQGRLEEVAPASERANRLPSVVEGDNQTDRTSWLRNSQGGVALVGRSVGIEDTHQAAADVRAVLTEVVADTHTLDGQAVELSDDAGDIPAGVATVLLAAHVEFTPGGSVLAKVGGGDVTRSGSPTTLRVVVNSNVLDLTLLEGEAQSVVGLPEAIHLAVGTVGVPEKDGPGLGLSALEADNVLVLTGIGFGNLDDIAAPGDANVADVVPVENADLLGVAWTAESGAGEHAVGRSFEPLAAGAGGGNRLHGGFDLAGGGSGLDGGGSGSRGDNDGLGRRRRGGGSRSDLAGPVVDPGLENAIDRGSDDVADITLAQVQVQVNGAIGGQRGLGLDLDLDLGLRVGVGVTALVAVQTSRGRASGQGRGQKEGILEVHDGYS